MKKLIDAGMVTKHKRYQEAEHELHCRLTDAGRELRKQLTAI
jgi:DNA-binding MarR family transcriptional regulator